MFLYLVVRSEHQRSSRYLSNQQKKLRWLERQRITISTLQIIQPIIEIILLFCNIVITKERIP
jgi:hypothetical protein